MSSKNHPTRRDAIRMGLAAGVGLTFGRMPLSAQMDELSAMQQLALITKKIPSTGELLPVVGIGTNRFSTNAELKPVLCSVISKLTELGGKVIDTARGYGTSEEVIGQCVKEVGNRDKLFIVTKYSIGGRGRAADPAAPAPDPKPGLDLAFSRLQMDRIDLMMVHNLGGTDALLPLMKEHKQAGRFRYLGISISSDSNYPALAEYMRGGQLDFIEVDYSLGNRNAAEMILPLAQERGLGVLINVPFDGRGGGLIQKVAGKPLPDFAKEFDATSWPQLFLKYVVSHPAVTVVIPGTTKVDHVIDNNNAARGRLPDAAMRTRIEQYFDSLPA